MFDRASDNPHRRAAELQAEMEESERYAGELAGYASQLRLAGHDDAAARLLDFSRRYRICALDQLGRLTALVGASPDEL